MSPVIKNQIQVYLSMAIDMAESKQHRSIGGELYTVYIRRLLNDAAETLIREARQIRADALSQ